MQEERKMPEGLLSEAGLHSGIEETKMETMIGQKAGRWTILGELRKGRFLYYECRCDCGTVREVKANSIRCGRSRSCGCLRRERALDVISENSKNRIETNAAFRTNFQIIEREKPPKNNKSGHKGVYWEKQKGVLKAIIYVQKRCIYLGSYHDIRDAIQTREDAEKKYFLPLIEAKRGAKMKGATDES
jgi:hypothetical protein